MAKVYDALRRAEEERLRMLGNSARPAPLGAEPVGPAAEKADRKSIWKRAAKSAAAGPVPDGSAEVNKRRIALLQPDSHVAEQFRALRGRIDAISSQRPLCTISVTSAFPGEGKTTCSVNLGIVSALSVATRVLLIDCDLRRPKVHRSLGLEPEVGLAELLTGRTTLDEALLSVDGANLDVLPVRSRPSNPSELLGSPEMTKLVEEVSTRYDRIILDTPAALGLPDAKVVSEFCDGMVLVVRADATSQSDIQAVLEILDRRRLLGMLINSVDVPDSRYGYAR